MITLKIAYRIKTATEEEICRHLINCSRYFIPALSEYVEIGQYSKKIFTKAITFEAWVENTLSGMVAAYFNDIEKKSGYITSVSIEPKSRGMGIASTLIQNCIEYATSNQFKEIQLEVNKKNEPAINLYQKHGFVVTEELGASLFMRRNCL